MRCRKLLFCCVVLAAVLYWVLPGAGGVAQEAGGEVRLIMQGDDMGAAHGVNVGTLQAYKEGILRATNVLTPAPWMPEAARMLNENPGLDAGVHLTLTSEWETIKWRPLTPGRTLTDANGYFFRMVQPLKGSPGNSVVEAKPDLAEIERELRAQIEMAKRMVPHISYLSSHMGFTSYSPAVRDLVARLAKEYKLATSGPELGIQSLGRVWDAKDGAEARAEKLAAKLATLGPGTYLSIEHCATDTPEVRAMGENVAFDRSAVVAAWSHPKVLEAVRKHGIRLTSYRELLAARR